LVSGFVTAAELSGSPPLKRRLSLWAAPRHRPDTPWRNTLMSSPRAVKRPAVDFVGFVIWDLYKSQHTICVPRNGAGAATTRNPSAPLTHPAYNVLMEYFGPTMTAVAGLSSDLIGCVLPEAR
jgi:hypothetical protein